jgi:hypothetical protein
MVASMSRQDTRRALVDGYRAQAAEAAKMADELKNTSVGSDWEDVAKSFSKMADEIERL